MGANGTNNDYYVLLDRYDIPSGTSKVVSKNTKLNLEAIPKDGWKFIECRDDKGNIIDITNFIITEDTILYFKFVQKKIGGYTLYVTSMEGGNAYTNGNSKHGSDKVIKTTDALGKTVYKIEHVQEGEQFYIYYDVNKGYEFDKWEYKPYITEKKENNLGKYTYITMPASDLTVTAVFKSSEVKDDPNLRITTNNKVWGDAYTTEIKGVKRTYTDKEYKVAAGTKLNLTRKSNTGYYFINWKYSTEFSPFIEANKILMPDYNLEVMAMFAPIPLPEDDGTPPGVTPHKIDFRPAPPEGGEVPEDIDGVYPGSKVTIGVTPNVGWEFDYWEVPDGVEIYYEPDGTGYFIMPDEDVIAIAHFKKAGTYKLYVTYTTGGTAWTYDIIKNPTAKTTYVPEAIPEMLYQLEYKVDKDYEFAGWEYRWNEYGEGKKIDKVVNGVQKVIMPYSDLTVTAKFRKINQTGNYKLRVTSNNYLWGNAWVVVDGKTYSWKDGSNPIASSKDGITLSPDKDYEVYFKEEKGYVFTNWVWTPDNGTYFTTRDDTANTSKYTGYGKIRIPASELKSDIELMAYFKPGDPDKNYKLTVKTDPTGAGKTYGGGKYGEGDEYTVSVDVKDGYEFKYWKYTSDDGKTVKIYNEEFTGIMPGHDLTIIAVCKEIGDGGGDDPEPEKYTVTVLVEGDGEVTGDIPATPDKPGEKEVPDGDSVTETAKPGDGSKFIGWKIKGKIVSQNKKEKFTVNGEDMVITACFTKISPSDTADTFKIISVRDLRWQDYFVNKNSLTGKFFGVPQSGVMLQNLGGKYSNILKMGYAVEFELTTSQLKPENAVLIIKPKLYDKKGNPISWSKVKDYVVSSKGEIISSDFQKIVIYGNDKKIADKTKYQTEAKVGEIKNNGESINQITWRWVYYLPADIWYDGYTKSKDSKNEDEITVRFDIQLHELNDGKYVEPTSSSNGTLKENIVLFEQKYNGVTWNGDVYKYSMKHSLLEDIYNNATN